MNKHKIMLVSMVVDANLRDVSSRLLICTTIDRGRRCVEGLSVF